MPTTRPPPISARKRPRQARSAQLVADVLEAAIRVLLRDGGARFTTVRVAEEAGVSVGSLYQYFPNKEALLFRLQAEEWDETWSILEEILADRRAKPLERLARAVVTFFRSEREETPLRAALEETGVRVDESPEKRKHHARAMSTFRTFLDEALPRVPLEARHFAAELVMTSMSAVAERLTNQGRSRVEVDAWAEASARMYCDYLERVRKEHAPQKARVAPRP